MTKAKNVRDEVAERAINTIQHWQNVASEAQRINAAREEACSETINEVAQAIAKIFSDDFVVDFMEGLTMARDYLEMGELDENATSAAEELVNSLTVEVSPQVLDLLKQRLGM